MVTNVVVVETKKRVESRTWKYGVLTIIGVILTALLADANTKEILGSYVVLFIIADKFINLYLRDTTNKAIGDGKPKINLVDEELRKELEEQGLV